MKTKQAEEARQATESPMDEEIDTPNRDQGVDAATDVEIQLRLNELRREYLDDRSDSINRWLGVIGIVLALFAIIIPIAAYFTYNRFQNIESQAREHLNEAKKHSNQAEEHASEAANYLEKIKEHETTAGENSVEINQ